MRSIRIGGLVLLVAAATFGCSQAEISSNLSAARDVQASCVSQADDIAAKLACIPGLTFTQVDDATIQGYTRYDMQFEQPEDHARPDGKKFMQKLVLLHKAETEPMLLHTSGYSIFGVRLSNVAQHFGMNQIQVEHRFFSGSIPEEADWRKLDIRQSAADFHRITENFKAIYAGKWLNTGASKGGMTSVYHRRFYPRDLDGTLALVAPLSFSKDDARYVTFVDNVGGEAYAECRAKLVAIQRALLSRRAELQSDRTGTFSQLGSLDVAWEHMVIELPFAFFQYGAASEDCATIPAADATVEELRLFQETVAPLEGYSDEGMAGFVPYYFQAANQLGGPGANLEVIGDLLAHKETYNLDQYIPAGLPTDYSNSAMIDVKNWVLRESQKIMFVYGELDPWTAGQFEHRKNQGGDSYKYQVAGGNHGANVFLLNPADKAQALAQLGRWIGKTQDLESAPVRIKDSLEDFEASLKVRF